MHILWRGELLQRARLVSGLILFAFAATHFLNHALGLISVDLMQDAQKLRWVVTRSVPGTVVLATALITHIVLALYKLARRTTVRLPWWETLQIGLGLSIPFLLFPHIVNTRVASSLFGVNDIYLYELARLWPDSAILQSVLLLMVWIHGCLGIHFWLRLYAPYRRLKPVLLAFAVFVPVAALGGFMVAGRGVSVLIADPEMLANVKDMTRWPSDADAAALAGWRNFTRLLFGIVVAFVAGYIALGRVVRFTGPKVEITYTGGPRVLVPWGSTLLEISRQSRVPHASVCGGRARCSTCRVRIDRGLATLPPAVFPEVVTLASIGAPDNVRLACQIVPAGDLTVTRLLRAEKTGPEAVDLEEQNSAGAEQTLAVMFVDMRHFTQLSQQRLPFDIVYILNEFFTAAGEAIHAHDGRIDKFLGDGLLAVFGERAGIEAGCRQALQTARAIDLALDSVNAKLEAEIGRPLEVGIGIDAGSLVLGRIGFGTAIDYTVIGNAVNVASRLEALSKEKGFQIMLSREVARHADWSPADEFTMQTEVRGVEGPVEVIGVKRGRDLPDTILATGEAGLTPKPKQGVARVTP